MHIVQSSRSHWRAPALSRVTTPDVQQAVDPAHRQLGAFKTGDVVQSSPAVANGVAYVGSTAATPTPTGCENARRGHSPRPDDLSGAPSLDAALEGGRDRAHGNGVAAGVERAELLVAVLGQPGADGVDARVALEAEGGGAHEAFDAAVGHREARRLRDRVVEEVAGHERERSPVRDQRAAEENEAN